MRAILDVVLLVLDLYKWVVIAGVVLSWLLAFNVVNYSNNLVRSIWQAVNALTEPLLAPIRRFMPNLGGLDLSPVILLLGVFFVQNVIARYIYPNVF
jgi:YggT family protein